jgi:hypothetical protein
VIDQTSLSHSSDPYLTRLAKYVPGEATGLFLLLSAIKPSWVFGTAIACLVFSGAWIWFTGRNLEPHVKPRRWNYFLSALAFPFWAIVVSPDLAATLPGRIDHSTATYCMVVAAVLIPAIDGYLNDRFPRLLPRR